jgi:hypothetical protein
MRATSIPGVESIVFNPVCTVPGVDLTNLKPVAFSNAEPGDAPAAIPPGANDLKSAYKNICVVYTPLDMLLKLKPDTDDITLSVLVPLIFTVPPLAMKLDPNVGVEPSSV